MAGLSGCTGRGARPDDPLVPNEPDYKGWFDGVSVYKGTVDRRGQSDVTVEVGAQGANGYYYFAPAAVAVSPGTTVTWVWNGKGGTHNVVSEAGLFDSGAITAKQGHEFSHTFAEPGVFRYVCEPHRTMGMRGAVFVALDDPAALTGPQRRRGPFSGFFEDLFGRRT